MKDEGKWRCDADGDGDEGEDEMVFQQVKRLADADSHMITWLGMKMKDMKKMMKDEDADGDDADGDADSDADHLWSCDVVIVVGLITWLFLCIISYSYCWSCCRRKCDACTFLLVRWSYGHVDRLLSEWVWIQLNK